MIEAPQRLMSFRNGAQGCLSVTWKVYLSIARSDLTAWSVQLTSEFGCRTRSNENSTSAEVTGVPSQKRAFLRRWNVYHRAALRFTSHDVARSGTTFVPSGFRRTSWS